MTPSQGLPSQRPFPRKQAPCSSLSLSEPFRVSPRSPTLSKRFRGEVDRLAQMHSALAPLIPPVPTALPTGLEEEGWGCLQVSCLPPAHRVPLLPQGFRQPKGQHGSTRTSGMPGGGHLPAVSKNAIVWRDKAGGGLMRSLQFNVTAVISFVLLH